MVLSSAESPAGFSGFSRWRIRSKPAIKAMARIEARFKPCYIGKEQEVQKSRFI
jgi:hypothetical protein